MRKARVYLLLILLLACNSIGYKAYAKELQGGLYFQSHTVIPEERTSLNLTLDKASQLKDGLILDFEVLLRKEEHNYGYITRIIINDTLNVDLLGNNGWGNNQLSLIKGNQHIIDLQNLELVSKYSAADWLNVRLVINHKEQRIQWFLNGKEDRAMVVLPQVNNVQIVFGLSSLKQFKSTDVAPMSLRNITIKNIKERLIRDWSLQKHGEGETFDEVENARAVVKNGIWSIDDHIRWKKLVSFSLPQGNGQITPYQKADDMGLFAIQKDTIYQYSITNNGLSKIHVRGGIPYNATIPSLIYDNVDNILISYTLEDENFNVFNFHTKEWDKSKSDILLSYLQHANCYIEDRQELVVFGGYGFYKYNAILQIHRKDTSGWEKKDLSQFIEPRYMSSMGYMGDGKILLMGGYGSKSGKQEETPQSYYDLHLIDLDRMSVKKIWDFSNEKLEVFGSSIIVDDDKKSFYTLSFANDRAHTFLKLNKFDLNAPNRVLLADSIPFLFHDTKSYSRLFYDKSNSQFFVALISQNGNSESRVELYALKYPAFQTADVIQIPQVTAKSNASSKIPIVAIVFILAILMTLGTWLLFRRRKLQRMDKKVSQPVLHEEQKKSTIQLLGRFQVVNAKGEDITLHFSQILRNLLLYILLYSCRDGSGVTSERLTDIFWAGMNKSNAMNNRNVNLSKLRLLLKEIGDISISHKNGYWQLTMDDNISCDYIEILDLLGKIKSKRTISLDTLNRISELGRKGDLLPDITEEWIEKFRSEYSILISDVLLTAVEYPEVKKDFILLLNLAETMLSLDSIDETAIQCKCYALYHLGKKGMAKQVYESFCDDYMRILGTKPDFLYSEIIDKK
ncbi:hypothetical protein [uncultured Dysgonomonas sp.]|uniref:Putative Kelch repeat protein n=1 Tax=uncultured Dysgonomonas sp. TaxID=206096 RepID=A0A212JVP0_9BACT|nr:hypothetical protein [uncultured Dysgonomonas sp.]SBW03462.1 putative Kelch repeat protein [uncultured Dysgonomonas sp.]